eukprot:superscaffoldBa00000115_g1672
MTSLDPLKSAISIGNVDDTSLALPSVKQFRSGQQRVLEQVQSIKRTKSRQSSSKSGSTSLSPTSPLSDSVFSDVFKYSTPNGNALSGKSFSKTLSQEKNNNWQTISISKGSTVKRNTAASAHYERSFAPVVSMAVGKTNSSRSEPDQAWQRSMPKHSTPPQRLLSKNSTYRADRSQFITNTLVQSQPLYTVNGTGQTRPNFQVVCGQINTLSKTPPKPPVFECAPKSKGDSGSNGNSGVADITMKEAVEYLSSEDETYKHCGASYIQHNTFIDDKAKEESVENCVCILHNLTFQLEAEAPALFSRITTLAKTFNRSQSGGDSGPIGCFSPQSKTSDYKHHFDFPVVEDPQPTGAGWLIHSKTLQSYLSLLGSSQQGEIQEACCGALQNLTAHQSIVSSVMSQTIVQKLNGLQVISPLLKSNKVNLQRNAVALVGNLTQNPNLHSAIARKAIPELLGMLSAGTNQGNESDDTLAMACQTSNCLLMREPEMGRRLLNNNLINSLNDLSKNRYFPKASKAASLLLYNLWSDKDTQSFLKKQGMSKSSFVNDITTAAHKSVQIID